MKIAVISATVFKCPPDGYSGLEMIAWLCAKGLAERGHDVTLYAPEGSTCPGAKVHSLGPARYVNEKDAYSNYWPTLFDFDVVIDHSWGKWANMLRGEGKLKAPVLNVMHAPVNTMWQTLPPNVPKPCAVCISQDQANHFEAIFNQPARVCYNGVDLDFYKSIEGLERNDRFLFLARFSTIKGPLLAIEACKKVGVGLDLVGDTTITHEPEYFQHCKSLCDGKQIVMHGNASRGETVWWFSRSHAMIHPNRDFREPFGLAPVEAQACGLPCISWDHGAMRETVLKHDLVKSTDELAKLIEQYASYELVGNWRQAYCNNAKRFSVENMVNRYEELCNEAIETGGW